MQAFVEAALAACHEVYELIRTNSDEAAYSSFTKGAGGDISIGFDLMAEAVFVRELQRFGTILSEESGQIGEGDARIVIDPIDGSDNLLSNFPYYGASIALQQAGVTVAGIVCNFANADCHVRFGDEHYLTSLTELTKKEEILIHEHSRVGIFEKAAASPENAVSLIDAGLKFRSPGAIALSLAYAHYVNYVVFFGTMRSYDLEAGIFLCKDLFRYQDDGLLVIAKDRTVFDKILKIFKRGPN